MSDYQSSQCSETEASDFEYEGSSCSQDPYEESFGDARDSYEGSGYSHEEGYSDPHSECAQYTSSAASDSQRDTSSDSRDFDDGSKYSQEGGNPSYQHESAQNPEPQGTSSGEKNYEVTAHGTNEHVTSPKHFEAKPTFSSAVADEIQGNHWCNREYLNPNEGRGYHYSNQDGSFYYQNPDGSKYYNNGEGYARYDDGRGVQWEDAGYGREYSKSGSKE